MSCCPNVTYFARGNGTPLPNVRRNLGFCSKNPGNYLHENDDYINLKLNKAVIAKNIRNV